jgi:transposase
MRKPSAIQPHLSPEDLAQWVREAETRDEYQKRLTVWLTYIGPFHAQQVASMLQISVQAVWLWIGQYNASGPEGLGRKGRGGRRWSFLSWEDESKLMESFFERAGKGEIITVKQVYPEVCKALGKDVSMDYVYRLFHRHTWRKIGPRPRHIKANPLLQEEFKKNSPPSSKKR